MRVCDEYYHFSLCGKCGRVEVRLLDPEANLVIPFTMHQNCPRCFEHGFSGTQMRRMVDRGLMVNWEEEEIA